tara:strand:- start:308 stop:832 length:525 start_codon:yes stop_codon:yes gene_type:complete
MAEQANKNKITELLSMSEEINVLNQKVKQLVEDLNNTSEVVGSLQDLAGNLNSKVGQLNNGITQYTPDIIADNKQMDPSNTDGINERVRIVPTPENQHEYTPEAILAKESSLREATKEKSIKVTPTPERIVKEPIVKEKKENELKSTPGKKSKMNAKRSKKKRGIGSFIGNKNG